MPFVFRTLFETNSILKHGEGLRRRGEAQTIADRWDVAEREGEWQLLQVFTPRCRFASILGPIKHTKALSANGCKPLCADERKPRNVLSWTWKGKVALDGTGCVCQLGLTYS